jgi:hypothetical protein
MTITDSRKDHQMDNQHPSTSFDKLEAQESPSALVETGHPKPADRLADPLTESQASRPLFSQLDHLGRRRFLQGMGYTGLALAGSGLLPWGADSLSETQAAPAAALAWTQPAVLLRVSDAVKPGEMFTVYGEGIQGPNLQIFLSEAGHNITLAPVFTDPGGHFATAVLPANELAGIYHLTVKNNYGSSNSVLLNGARPQWLSEDTAFAGLKLKIVGRNLDPREWGATTTTRIRLSQGGVPKYYLLPETVNPFAITFSIPSSVASGVYDVSVTTTDGDYHWVNLAYTEEYNQRLTIVSASSDPLGLGVAWVNKFNWSRQVNVLDYGATPNNGSDDTTAIQNAINAVASQGGGKVYLPDGNYRITGLTLPVGVVLLGQSKTGTILTYANTAANASSKTVIATQNDANGVSAGKKGLARLTLTLDSQNASQVFPDIFINLGDGWGAGVQDELQRKAEYLFLSEVKLDYPLAKRTGRGIGMVVMAKGHFLVRRCEFSGYNATITSTYVSKYSQILDNQIKPAFGLLGVVGIFTIFERNYVAMRPDLKLGDSHGIFTRGPSYVADNTVENIGTVGHNDGEAYCIESFRGGARMIGTVSAATSTSVTVSPKWASLTPTEDQTWDPWDITHHCWAGWHILITEGRGLGQDRLLTGRNGSTYSLSKPWEVIPDSSSKYVVFMVIKGTTFYHNVAKNASKGYWFYNDAIDGVIANNNTTAGTNTEGCYVNTYYVERPTTKDYRYTIGYFNRIQGNTMTGISAKSKVVGIGSKTELSTGDAYAYQIYGFAIKGNSITSVLPAPAITGDTEAPDVNGLYTVNINFAQQATRNAILGVFIENNRVTNSDRGISLGGTGFPLVSQTVKDRSNPISYGVIIKGNTFTNVTQQVVDNGTTGTVYL